ncbi:MAG: peptidase [Oscillospiraceae bacterium]|nr:peptidase [Oscillospiraceae bacterium]
MNKKKPTGYWDKRRIVMAVLAVVMALLILLPMITMILPSANAATVTQSQINALKEKSDSLESQKSGIESQLSALEGKQDDLLDEKVLVEQQITVLQEQISTTQSLIDQYQSEIDDLNDQISEKQTELEEAQKQEEERYDLFCQRVRSMEEDGTSSFWAVIFNSKDFTDLLDRINFINEVTEYDNAVIEALEDAQQQVEDAKTQLEDSKTQQESAQAEQQTTQAQLKSQKSELDTQNEKIESLITELDASKEQYQSQLENLEDQTDAIDQEIQQKQAALEAQLANEQYQYDTGTGYLWPLPGHYYISSKFGARAAPLAGATTYHNGVDIPAPSGTSIQAARGGVVVTSDYNSSYGNYVVISHGNGDSTLYAHMSKRAVSEGDTVTQGQVIGYVGTTGSSTGNHLHFEIRIGGTRVNPLSYYPSLSFTIASS